MSLERGPEVPGAPVTACNWQDPPFNRWAFWHVGEILPTYRVSRGRRASRALPASAAGPDLSAMAIGRAPRLARHGGRGARRHLHRRVRGAAGRRAGRRVVRPARRAGPAARADVGVEVRASAAWPPCSSTGVSSIPKPRSPPTSPNCGASGYAGATVRHVLDMRSGVRFLEEYANPQADIRRLDEWIGWRAATVRRSEPAGCTGSWPRCGPRRRTGAGSSTARRNRTCWAGCASAPPADPWPS